MSAYYTPELKEFHVGFEYEIAANERDFVKKIFTKEDLKSFLYEKLENGINQEYIRVKHLDSEDIEECGFKYVASDWWSTNLYGDGYQILKTKNKINISYGQHEFSTIKFDGIIKNNSELKTLLKQLSIQ